MDTNSLLNAEYDRSKFTQANSAIWEKISAIKGQSFKNYRKILAEAEKGKTVTDFPVEVLIKTTLNCNHFCPKCPHGMDMYPRGAKYNMNFDTMKKVLDEGKKKGLQSVVFTGGEPTMHPQIIDFLDYAGKLQFPDISMISNGSLLSDEIINCVINSGLTRINISFDSVIPATYHKVRGVDHYARVIKNIDRFLQIRKERNSQLPLLSLSFVLQDENSSELDEFIEMWHEKADGGIKIYPYKNIYPVMKENFFNTYGKGNMAPDDFNHELFPQKLSHSTAIMNGYSIQCTIPWYRCHVGINGEIQGCTTLGFCDHPEMVMGNIHDMTFEEVWKSQKWSDLRRITLAGKYASHPVCNLCQKSI